MERAVARIIPAYTICNISLTAKSPRRDSRTPISCYQVQFRSPDQSLAASIILVHKLFLRHNDGRK